MGTEAKSSFDAEKVKATVTQRLKSALDRTLADAIVDIQLRLDSGRGIAGQSYTYSKQTAKKKGKASPVDWSDTGRLRGSIDFITKVDQDKLTGLIGVKDLQRGKASNKIILQSLIDRFPGMWGLSKAEIAKLYSNFIKYFKS